MHWTNTPTSSRQPVLARNVIATSQPLAAQAGAAAFARGGNAIDAALAAAITLTVVEPVMNGIGGDAFAQVWADGRLHGLNASGRAPAAWNPGRFKGLDAIPARGWDSVTVPGQVSAWVALSERFGALPFADLFGDAIRHARDGFPVSPVIAQQWAQELAALPTVALGYMKRNLNLALRASLSDVMDAEAVHMVRTFHTDDHKAAALTFVEKRKPQFNGR